MSSVGFIQSATCYLPVGLVRRCRFCCVRIRLRPLNETGLYRCDSDKLRVVTATQQLKCLFENKVQKLFVAPTIGSITKLRTILLFCTVGALGRLRTLDPLLRRQLLYPAQPPARGATGSSGRDRSLQ